jgi:hypothetical protein
MPQPPAMHFSVDACLIFLTDKLTNDRFLVDTGPLLKGANGKQIPSWGFITETVQFQGKMFTSGFLQAAVAGPILGIDFLRKFNITVAPETSQILFACTAGAFRKLENSFFNWTRVPSVFLSDDLSAMKEITKPCLSINRARCRVSFFSQIIPPADDLPLQNFKI